MKHFPVHLSAALLGLLASALLWPMRLDAADNSTNMFTAARRVYATDRQALVAANLQLSETEGAAFWPLYRQYRAEMERLGDGLVKLVLEYADAYPNVPEDRAQRLLKDYAALEQNVANLRASYLKKFARVIPAAKALRFAQVENRLDLDLRVQLASQVPLVPAEGR
jgi:hypothetical protein